MKVKAFFWLSLRPEVRIKLLEIAAKGTALHWQKKKATAATEA